MEGHDEHEQHPRMVVFGLDGQPVTVEELRTQAERAQASNEAFWADLRRMLFGELDEDQLHTLKHLFRLLGESPPKRSVSLANYFEGLTSGAEEAKRRAQPFFGLDPLEQPAEETLWSHPFVLKLDGSGCDTCGLDYKDKPHRRWEAGLRGDGSDGVDV